MSIRNEIFKITQFRSYVPIDEFMEIILTKHSDSYYKSKNPFDLEQGDFITSPQISQMFGEMIGVWVYNQWNKLGCPSHINLVELGPGTGALMRDLLSVLRKTDMFSAVDVCLYEVNPKLILIQKKMLENFEKITWISNPSEFPNSISIFVSNEFFDVFPIKQFIKAKEIWQEVVITSNAAGDDLIFDRINVNTELNEHLSYEYKNAGDGAVVEESQELGSFVKALASHVREHNSCALAIDYGYDINPDIRKATEYNGTLQGIKAHKFCPILDNIGEADLTAHVNFDFIRKVASSNFIKATHTIDQGEFLIKLGIDTRVTNLIKANPDLTKVLRNQHSRLVSVDGMGKLFKVIALSKKDQENFLFD